MSAADDRVARVERACALREQELLLREIAAAMGVALKTVHGWLSDPDGTKLKVATLVARLETGAWPVRAGVSRRSDWRPGSAGRCGLILRAGWRWLRSSKGRVGERPPWSAAAPLSSVLGLAVG